jgi:hypothetical protein
MDILHQPVKPVTSDMVLNNFLGLGFAYFVHLHSKKKGNRIVSVASILEDGLDFVIG